MKHKSNTLKLIAVLILLCQFVFAQEEQKQSKLAIGVHGGVGGTRWTGKTPTYEFRSTLSFMYGVKGKYRINKNLLINGEVNYERKGFNISHVLTWDTQYDIIQFEFDESTSISPGFYLGYITMPIILKLTTNRKKVNFFVNSGLYTGYLIKRYYILNCNPFDFGLVEGFGIDIAIKKHFQFSIEFRQNWGLKRTIKEYPNPRNKSENLLFGLAYKI